MRDRLPNNERRSVSEILPLVPPRFRYDTKEADGDPVERSRDINYEETSSSSTRGGRTAGVEGREGGPLVEVRGEHGSRRLIH